LRRKNQKPREIFECLSTESFLAGVARQDRNVQNRRQNALRMLVKTEKEDLSLRAGWPWFFQIWQRDEAVSLKGLAEFDKNAATAIFLAPA